MRPSGGRRAPPGARLCLGLFGLVGRLLPREFRRGYLNEAERDLADWLAHEADSQGDGAATWAGVVAVLDLVRRVPAEWWTALGGGRADRRDERGPRGGLGTRERLMMWMSDLRVAMRTLARRPGFTLTAAVTLALGIGATVAIFTVVDGILLRPLPYPEADRIVSIVHHAPALELPDLNNSEGTINFYRANGDFVSKLGAFTQAQHNLVGDGDPERVTVTEVTPEVFDVLQVQPALGRPFNAEDAQEDATPVAILTHAAWVSRYASDPTVLGRSLTLDGVATRIVGVMPAGFAFPDADAMALVPFYVDPDGSFGTFGTDVVARLAPGYDLQTAQHRAEELQARLYDFFPDDLEEGFLDQAGWGVTVERYQDQIVGEDVAQALWVVLGTVSFVLLIACANVANLFLVRAESRQKELAVRSAMGAGAGRIATGFLSEATILGVAGGLAGLLLAWGGVALLVAHGPSNLPRLNEVRVGGTSLAFTVALSLGTALFLGAFPLLRYRMSALAAILRDGGRANTVGRDRHRTRSVLVASQLALALVLLVGSGLMLRSFDKLRRIDPGYDPSDVLVMGMSLGDVPVERNAEAASFYQQVADAAAAVPGVVSVGLTSRAPLNDGESNGGSFYIENEPREEGALPPVAMYKVIGRDYLKTMRQPLLRGRDLTRSDWEGGVPVLLVNETFEKSFLGGDGVGKAVRWDREGAFARVVGVVADAREFSLRDEPRATAYLPMVVGDWSYPRMSRMYLVMRGEKGRALPVSALRDVIHRIGPQVPVTSARTMDEVMGRSMVQTSFTMILLGIAAGVALFLGAIGLFGVISYVVGQRTREIGVRVALGAAGSDIRSMVFRQSGSVAVAGVVLGLLGALALTRLMGAVLFEVKATDPVTFIGAPVLLICVAGLATWLPARRAARVDPIEALRTE